MCEACHSLTATTKLFRPHRLHAVQTRIAIKWDIDVDFRCSAWCVCACVPVCVCWAHGFAVQKWLNRSRCRLGQTDVSQRHRVLDLGQDRTNPYKTADTCLCLTNALIVECVNCSVYGIALILFFALIQYCQTESKQDTHRQVLRQVFVLTVLL